jgi:membrane-associated phospholipid phosphatase
MRALLCVAALSLPSQLKAQKESPAAPAAKTKEQEPPKAEATASASAAPEKQHRLVWIYPRFRWWEWGVALAATGYFSYSVLQDPRKVDMGWHGPAWGDTFMRDTFVAKGHAGRRRANNASNTLWHITEFFPFVDSLVVTLLTDDFNYDVAWQMTLLNWQGIAVMGALNRLSHDWMGRDRPALKGCEEHGPDYSEEFCQSDAPRVTQSFVSGHAGSVFFGAGATCAHHLTFPMYGHPVADIGICALALGAASTNGGLRMVADAHWFTDVLAGAVIGLGSGFGLAYGLHYAWPLQKLQARGIMVMPLVSENEAGLQVLGKL